MPDHAILDADGHVTESPEQVARYLDEPYRRRPLNFSISDYPHWDNSYPGSVEEIVNRGDLSAGQKRKILADNCRRLYGF